MLLRLTQLVLNRYVKSPGRSWLITTALTLLYRMVRSTTGRRELVDVSSIKPGEMIIIEHLPVTHKEQMKAEKKARRQARKSRRPWRRSAD